MYCLVYNKWSINIMTLKIVLVKQREREKTDPFSDSMKKKMLRLTLLIIKMFFKSFNMYLVSTLAQYKTLWYHLCSRSSPEDQTKTSFHLKPESCLAFFPCSTFLLRHSPNKLLGLKTPFQALLLGNWTKDSISFLQCRSVVSIDTTDVSLRDQITPWKALKNDGNSKYVGN